MLKYLKKKKLFGKINAKVLRIEYQKRGLPHAHILLWTDIDVEDISIIDKIVNTRYPKESPFLNDSGNLKDMKTFIDAYQIHFHSKRCGGINGKCTLNYPQHILLYGL